MPFERSQTAFDDPRLARVYGIYHEQILYLLRRSISAHGEKAVVLIDMHGFGKQPAFAPQGGYDLILGTANRSTIHHGDLDKEFARFMENRGYSVFLPSEQSVTANGDPYSAGHITRLYAAMFGINAIQIEIAAAFRERNMQDKGIRLSSDMAEFLAKR